MGIMENQMGKNNKLTWKLGLCSGNYHKNTWAYVRMGFGLWH